MATSGSLGCTRREHTELFRRCGRDFSGGVQIAGGKGTAVGKGRIKAGVGRQGYRGKMGGKYGAWNTFC